MLKKDFVTSASTPALGSCFGFPLLIYTNRRYRCPGLLLEKCDMQLCMHAIQVDIWTKTYYVILEIAGVRKCKHSSSPNPVFVLYARRD
jgi:hypothetical protein